MDLTRVSVCVARPVLGVGWRTRHPQGWADEAGGARVMGQVELCGDRLSNEGLGCGA